MFEVSAPGIKINHLNLKYQHHWLFNQFDLDMPAAQWTCLLGASGVGKSTLLKFLAGLPTGVDIILAEQAIQTSDNQSLRGRISYMSQQDSLMPWLTVLENSLLGFRLRGEVIKPEIRNRALELLERVGLQKAIQLKPSQLSGGMRQRVAIVRTLLEEKPVVLMDEPFSALDVLTRLKLQDLAVELLMGKTVLLVTHDPLEALRLADRICIMSGAPARVSEILTLDIPRPRSLEDQRLLTQQGKLLNLLIRQ